MRTGLSFWMMMRRRGYAFIYGNADDWDVIRDCHEKRYRLT